MITHAPQILVASLLGIALMLSFILYVIHRRAQSRPNEGS